MEPGQLDLEIIRGTTWTKELKRFKDEKLTEPFDWTGWGLEWIVGSTLVAATAPRLVVVEKYTVVLKLSETDTKIAKAMQRDPHKLKITSPAGEPDFLLVGYITWKDPVPGGHS